MASRLKIQIVDVEDGVVYEWAPGLPLEAEFVETLADRVAAKPVGILTTRAGVRQAVKEATEAFLYDLKRKVR